MFVYYLVESLVCLAVVVLSLTKILINLPQFSAVFKLKRFLSYEHLLKSFLFFLDFFFELQSVLLYLAQGTIVLRQEML